MEGLVFNNEILEKHSLFQKCPSTLQELSERDYGRRYYFKPEGIECIDLDTYEKSRSGQPDCTVDAVIGVCNNRNLHLSDYRLLCIELRMDYKTTSHFSVSNFENKIRHSLDLLGEEIRVDQLCYFIYDDRFYPKAFSWFSREAKVKSGLRSIRPCSVSIFPNLIKSVAEMPYEPIHDVKAIQKGFDELIINKNWDTLIIDFYELCQDILRCKQHNPFEYAYMREYICCSWKQFKIESFPKMNQTQKDIAEELIEEEFSFMFF